MTFVEDALLVPQYYLFLLAKIKVSVPANAHVPLSFFIMTLFLKISSCLGYVRDCKKYIPLGERTG